MRIVVFEYLTGGGLLSQNLSRSLIAEGALMVQALIEDLLAISGVTLNLILDHRAKITRALNDPRVEEICVSSESQLRVAWREQLACCDAAWAIAPETGGILERLCRDIEGSGAFSLNCPAEAVRIAGSKLETARRLDTHGVRTIPTWAADSADGPETFPGVVKPDDGVGCLGSRILRSADEWQNWRQGGDRRGYVVQPLVAGDPLSLSALFDHGQSVLLSCNRQHVREIDDRFVLEACSVNAWRRNRSELECLCSRVAEAIPELWGYAGVDFIDTEDGPMVLEINPRITTSYAGLREALGVNPAQMICNALTSGSLPGFEPRRNGTVKVSVEPHDVD